MNNSNPFKNKLLTDGGVSRPIPGQMLIDYGTNFAFGVNVDIKSFKPINDINLIQILGRCEQITTNLPEMHGLWIF